MQSFKCNDGQNLPLKFNFEILKKNSFRFKIWITELRQNTWKSVISELWQYFSEENSPGGKKNISWEVRMNFFWPFFDHVKCFYWHWKTNWLELKKCIFLTFMKKAYLISELWQNSDENSRGGENPIWHEHILNF